jgi:hypothetical protein
VNLARQHFDELNREQQAEAIRELIREGLSVEMIRQILAAPELERR